MSTVLANGHHGQDGALGEGRPNGASAEEIADALRLNQVRGKLSRVELKGMVNRGDWFQIGQIFGFTPKLARAKDGRAMIDWNSVPREVIDLLGASRPAAAPAPQRKLRVKEIIRQRPLRMRVDHRMVTFQTQLGVCGYCQQTTPFKLWTIDHRIPLSRGGRNHFSNKIGACLACNGAKANLTDEEFRAVRRDPRALKEAVRAAQAEAQNLTTNGHG